MGFLHGESWHKGRRSNLADHLHRLVWSSFPRESKDPPRGRGEGSSLQEGDEHLPRDPSAPLQSGAELCCIPAEGSSIGSQQLLSQRLPCFSLQVYF